MLSVLHDSEGQGGKGVVNSICIKVRGLCSDSVDMDDTGYSTINVTNARSYYTVDAEKQWTLYPPKLSIVLRTRSSMTQHARIGAILYVAHVSTMDENAEFSNIGRLSDRESWTKQCFGTAGAQPPAEKKQSKQGKTEA